LKKADAAFFCGTGAEVIGFESLDDYKFPLKWNDSISRKIQVAYMKLVKEDFFEPQRQGDTKKHREATV
jgi:branched-chain amino acid aminotransferase